MNGIFEDIDAKMEKHEPDTRTLIERITALEKKVADLKKCIAQPLRDVQTGEVVNESAG